MQFYQTNNNKGDVNNASTQFGDIIQSKGDKNHIKDVSHPKNTLTALWKWIKSIWSLIT